MGFKTRIGTMKASMDVGFDSRNIAISAWRMADGGRSVRN